MGRVRVQTADLLGDRAGRRRQRRRPPSHGCGHPRHHRPLGAHAGLVVAPVRVVQPGVTEVGHERPAGRGRDRLGHQMGGAGRRRRHDHVDVMPAHHPDAGRDGGRQPRRRLVGDQRPLVHEAGLGTEPAEPGAALQRVRMRRRARAQEPAAVHRGGGRDRLQQVLVAGEPLGVVRGQHVHLDAVLRQELAELERPLHASASGRREVEGDDQDSHHRGSLGSPPLGSPR